MISTCLQRTQDLMKNETGAEFDADSVDFALKI